MGILVWDAVSVHPKVSILKGIAHKNAIFDGAGQLQRHGDAIIIDG
jgi:hypothetical protein